MEHDNYANETTAHTGHTVPPTMAFAAGGTYLPERPMHDAAAGLPGVQVNVDVMMMAQMEDYITVHRLYPQLLNTWFSCRKVGEDGQTAEELEVVKIRLLQGIADFASKYNAPPDPTLDEFMTEYCRILEEYHRELVSIWRQADQACIDYENQLMELLHAPVVSDSVTDGGDEDSQSGDQAAEPAATARSNQRSKLRDDLKAKYAGDLLRLKGEFARKPKKAKLPACAVAVLKAFFDEHLQHPYPKESEKKTLATTTRLDLTQINNWFINERKRHWKKEA